MRRCIITVLFITHFFVLSGCSRSTKENNYEISSISKEQGEMENIILYFSDENAEYLVSEERLVKPDKNLETTIIRELLRGPSTIGIESAIPKGTKLLSINRKGNAITVDLSKEFIKNHPGGSTGEIMTIFSIVNSLTEIPGVENVLFEVGGKTYETLAGHMTFSEPFARDRSLIKRDKNLNPSEVLNRQMNLEKQGKWLEAYLLMSDKESNPDRKYYNDYVKDMQEVQGVGFTEQEFVVGNYALDKGGSKARVKVNFYYTESNGKKALGEDIYFNCVKIDGAWMVDWLTVQDKS